MANGVHQFTFGSQLIDNPCISPFWVKSRLGAEFSAFPNTPIGTTPGLSEALTRVKGPAMNKTANKFSPEVRTRAVRMVLDHESDYPSRWATVVSVAEKIGCVPQTSHEWVKMADVDSDQRAGVPSDTADKFKALERENRELRQANEILRKASAYFAHGEGGAAPLQAMPERSTARSSDEHVYRR